MPSMVTLVLLPIMGKGSNPSTEVKEAPGLRTVMVSGASPEGAGPKVFASKFTPPRRPAETTQMAPKTMGALM